jgi:hypothetical protein
MNRHPKIKSTGPFLPLVLDNHIRFHSNQTRPNQTKPKQTNTQFFKVFHGFKGFHHFQPTQCFQCVFFTVSTIFSKKLKDCQFLKAFKVFMGI